MSGMKLRPLSLPLDAQFASVEGARLEGEPPRPPDARARERAADEAFDRLTLPAPAETAGAVDIFVIPGRPPGSSRCRHLIDLVVAIRMHRTRAL